jgi:hypothetical protein
MAARLILTSSLATDLPTLDEDFLLYSQVDLLLQARRFFQLLLPGKKVVEGTDILIPNHVLVQAGLHSRYVLSQAALVLNRPVLSQE